MSSRFVLSMSEKVDVTHPHNYHILLVFSITVNQSGMYDIKYHLPQKKSSKHHSMASFVFLRSDSVTNCPAHFEQITQTRNHFD